MKTTFRPSNGSEGEMFMARNCYNCVFDNGDTLLCELISNAMAYNVENEKYPKEWTCEDVTDPATWKCSKFKKRKQTDRR